MPLGHLEEVSLTGAFSWATERGPVRPPGQKTTPPLQTRHHLFIEGFEDTTDTRRTKPYSRVVPLQLTEHSKVSVCN